MKSVKGKRKPSNGNASKGRVRKTRATDKRAKGHGDEPTANEVMLEAWKEIFKTRHRRLL